jgi:isopentenyl phosphate kinase
LFEKNNIKKIVQGKKVGTTVSWGKLWI